MLRWQVIALGVIALKSLGSNLCRGRHGHPRRAIASVVTTVYMVNKRHHGGLNPALAMASTCYSCSPIPGGQRRLLDPASFSRLPTVLCSASLRSRHQRNTSLTLDTSAPLLHPFCAPSTPLPHTPQGQSRDLEMMVASQFLRVMRDCELLGPTSMLTAAELNIMYVLGV